MVSVSGLETVLVELKAAGFEELERPVRIAGTEFDFEAAAVGTGSSHDLVLLATDATPQPRLNMLMEGLTRALDHLQSRRPVSLILLGEPPSLPAQDRLERNARLLLIHNDKPDSLMVKRAIAVLMPLTLPATQKLGRNPIRQVIQALGTSISPEHLALIEAAPGGTDNVQKTLKRYIDDVFDDRTDGPSAS